MSGTHLAEKLSFFANIEANGQSRLSRLLCHVELPLRSEERVLLSFAPDRIQAEAFNRSRIWKCSVTGDLRDGQGRIIGKIEAPTVTFSRGVALAFPGDEVFEGKLIGVPDELTITKFWNKQAQSPPQTTLGFFWVTHNSLLSPSPFLITKPDGNVEATDVGNFEFVLNSGTVIRFENSYKYYVNESRERVSFSELVAAFSFPGTAPSTVSIPPVFVEFDHVLVLAAMASRRPAGCFGWDTIGPTGAVSHYLNNRSRPEKNSDSSRVGSWLIDPADFDEFMAQAYRAMNDTGPDESVVRAVRKLVPLQSHTVESEILDLFTAIEMIVAYFRRIEELTYVFSPSDPAQTAKWKSLRQEIVDTVDAADLGVDNNKKALLKGNLDALNRVSFNKAFRQFCRRYSVKVDDLWPLTPKGSDITITWLRNKLVHGEVFHIEHRRALTHARYHVQWILERMLLGFLGWDVEKSTVNALILSGMIPYKEWRESRDSLASDFAS